MRQVVTAMAVASLLVGSLAAAAGAQQSAPGAGDPRTQERRTTEGNEVSKGLKPGTAKASDIIGMTVENQNGDNLGKIEDLVLDRAGNRVAFVVFEPSSKLLSADSARPAAPAAPSAAAPGSAAALRTDAARTDRADMNERYFALPWRDFKQSGKKLVLAVDATQVLKARSFPKSQWPNLGDSKWTEEFAKAEGGAATSGGKADFVRAHDFMKKNVRNEQNEKLGSVDELVLDLTSGRVLYAVLAEGGLLGLGEKLFAIPLTAFRPTNDHKELLLAADKDRLKSAQGFDKNSWPTTAGRGWDQGGGGGRSQGKS